MEVGTATSPFWLSPWCFLCLHLYLCVKVLQNVVYQALFYNDLKNLEKMVSPTVLVCTLLGIVKKNNKLVIPDATPHSNTL